jgi:hypothetical protein
MLALTPDDERFHAPGPEEQWSDSLYFGGGDPRRGAALDYLIQRSEAAVA